MLAIISLFRSPWSNKYIPDSSDGYYPIPSIRKLEEDANFLFERYTKMYPFVPSFIHRYYGGGISSVYMWDNDDNICGCFMVLNGRFVTHIVIL